MVSNPAKKPERAARKLPKSPEVPLIAISRARAELEAECRLVDDQDIDLVVSRIRRIQREAGLDYALQVGSLVYHYFFGGDPQVLRARGPKGMPFRRLAERPDLPLSPSSLYRCVEIYASLVYDGFRSVSALSLAPEAMRSRIIVIDGVSKAYAMTGWRIGWSIAPVNVSKALDIVQSQSTTNATAIAQAAAVAALNGDQACVESMRQTFEARRNRMVAALNGVPGVSCRTPEGAFYAFADFRGLYGISSPHAASGRLANDLEVAKFLIEEAGVAAVPGSAFGAPGYLRFSYATSESVIDQGIAAVRAAVERAR